MRRNTDQRMCSVYRKEEERSHVLRRKGTKKTLRYEMLDKKFTTITYIGELELEREFLIRSKTYSQ